MEDDFHKQNTQPGFKPEGQVPLHEEKIPPQIGPYKIESLLETGGMSIVYLAVHPETKDPVTIKVLSSKFLSNPEAVQRFVNEAEIIAMADHPNIVKLYGHGEWEGGLYIAMEFVQGVSLRQFLKQTPLSLKKALELILDIAYALCHLHTHGVIHRDLKPENILITEEGVVKVIDFGIAQLLKENGSQEELDSGITQKPRFMGTPFYMSPEQKHFADNISYSSDIYSLGIITYELVQGKLSHGQIQLSVMPRGLQPILAKALQPRPEDRYQDIVDFISDLSTYVNSEKIQNDKKGADYFSEITEHIFQVHAALLGRHPPTEWQGMDIGMATYRGMSIPGSYSDFLTSENKYGIVLAESSGKGVTGVVYTAGLRGAVRSAEQFIGDPAVFAKRLNGIVIGDVHPQIFSLCYLVLNPAEDQLQFISCGYGNLWHLPAGMEQPIKISSENPALGIDAEPEYTAVSHPWKPGDMILLTTLPLEGPKVEEAKAKEFSISENSLLTLISENHHLPAQKQADLLLRRIKTGSPKAMEDRHVSLVVIQRI